VVEAVACRQVAGAAFHQVVEVVALHHREGEAYRQVGEAAFHQVVEAVACRQVAGAAFHQLAEVVALHLVVVVFLDQAAAQLQN
jgi:hypothetical protein